MILLLLLAAIGLMVLFVVAAATEYHRRLSPASQALAELARHDAQRRLDEQVLREDLRRLRRGIQNWIVEQDV